MSYVRPEGLPQYHRPPVQEVRMDMIFEPLAIKVTQLHELHAMWEESYPTWDERSPEMIRLAGLDDRPGGLRIEIADTPRIPLIRFEAEDGTRWIELQADRLSCGWTGSGEGEYPRYGQLRSQFASIAIQLASFVPDENIQVVQLSMSYLNEFPVPGDGPMEAIAKAFCFESYSGPMDGAEKLSSAGLNLHFQYRHEGSQYAELSATSRVRRGDAGVVSRLKLRFTGDPWGTPGADERDGFASILGFFDEGHEAIVETFTATTSHDLHREWGRY